MKKIKLGLLSLIVVFSVGSAFVAKSAKVGDPKVFLKPNTVCEEITGCSTIGTTACSVSGPYFNEDCEPVQNAFIRVNQ